MKAAMMSRAFVPKYPSEFFLEFISIDRFLFRVSDLRSIPDHTDDQLLDRLDNCHIYFLGKRPRISIVPGNVQANEKSVRLQVEYRVDGAPQRADVELPHHLFSPEEHAFEAAPYPHRELVGRDDKGRVIAQTLLANFVHLMPSVHARAKDFEVVYVGKGLRHSAQDRLEHHASLQRILADLNSNEPDAEVFALVYAFKYQKNALAFPGMTSVITGKAARQRRERAMSFQPSLDDQIALVDRMPNSVTRFKFI